MAVPGPILHVNDIASVASTLQAAQRRAGQQSDLLDPAKPGASWPWPWKILSVCVRMPLLVWMAVRIRRRHYALVHVHYATQAVIGPLTGRPYVVHCHGSDVRGASPTSIKGRMLRLLMRRAALVVFATPDLARDVLPLRPDAVYLPNPIDIAAFAPGREPTRDVIAGVRLSPVKGATTAVEGLRLVVDARPSTSVTVVASGSLLPWARERLGGRASFVPPRPHDEMPELLADHRLALGQFRLGILSQLELEAMACGAPVVGTVGYPDADGDRPPLAEASDPGAVADVVLGLLADDRRRRELGAASRAWVEQHHAADRVVERLNELYAAAV